MAALTTQTITIAGTDPTYAAAGVAGDSFRGDAKTFVHVLNGGGGSINVTVDSQATAGTGLAQANSVVAVAASGEKMIGPFPPAWVNSDGNVLLTYSGVTSVTIAVLRLP